MPSTPLVPLAKGKPLDTARWIAKGDAICARANAKVVANPARSVRDFPRVLPQLALYIRAEAAELAKLVPPAGRTHDWVRIVNDVQMRSRYASELAQLVQANKATAISRQFHLLNLVTEDLLTTAQRGGFKRCSKAS